MILLSDNMDDSVELYPRCIYCQMLELKAYADLSDSFVSRCFLWGSMNCHEIRQRQGHETKLSISLVMRYQPDPVWAWGKAGESMTGVWKMHYLVCVSIKNKTRWTVFSFRKNMLQSIKVSPGLPSIGQVKTFAQNKSRLEFPKIL
mgnify:CR=1 FL=1